MNLLKDLRGVFIPDRCYHCCAIINNNLSFLCIDCSLQLEQTQFINFKDNPLEKLFWGKVTIHQAASLYFYYKQSPIQSLLKELKYKNLQEFGEQSAKAIINDLQNSHRFKNIDLVIPVPLHVKKEKERGYNQVEVFGNQIAKHLDVPFCKDLLIKTKHNKSQTNQTKEERHKSVQNIFSLNPKHNLTSKNILIVDDVLTTGATLISCSKTIKDKHNVNIFIITIACVV